MPFVLYRTGKGVGILNFLIQHISFSLFLFFFYKGPGFCTGPSQSRFYFFISDQGRDRRGEEAHYINRSLACVLPLFPPPPLFFFFSFSRIFNCTLRDSGRKIVVSRFTKGCILPFPKRKQATIFELLLSSFTFLSSYSSLTFDALLV